jgi:hypothetical protein
MSAFMVSAEHMNRIVTYAAEVLGVYHGTPTPDLYWGDTLLPIRLDMRQELGDLLMAENARSIGARYGVQEGATADTEVFTWTYQRTKVVSAVEFLKLCVSLDYQSCESSDYQKTGAFFVLRALILRAISEIPGYGAAQWAA